MEQSLVIAMVGMLGIGAQWLAWRTGWPAIVLMLAAGFLAGPILGLFDPEHAFGDLLDPMIAIGVALILFEGGLSLDFRELRHAGDGVWRLVIFGVPIAWVLGAVSAHSIAGMARRDPVRGYPRGHRTNGSHAAATPVLGQAQTRGDPQMGSDRQRSDRRAVRGRCL